jgi:hypothetical protein
MDIEAFGQRLKELRNNKSQADIVKLIFEKTGLIVNFRYIIHNIRWGAS